MLPDPDVIGRDGAVNAYKEFRWNIIWDERIT